MTLTGDWYSFKISKDIKARPGQCLLCCQSPSIKDFGSSYKQFFSNCLNRCQHPHQKWLLKYPPRSQIPSMFLLPKLRLKMAKPMSWSKCSFKSVIMPPRVPSQARLGTNDLSLKHQHLTMNWQNEAHDDMPKCAGICIHIILSLWSCLWSVTEYSNLSILQALLASFQSQLISRSPSDRVISIFGIMSHSPWWRSLTPFRIANKAAGKAHGESAPAQALAKQHESVAKSGDYKVCPLILDPDDHDSSFPYRKLVSRHLLGLLGGWLTLRTIIWYFILSLLDGKFFLELWMRLASFNCASHCLNPGGQATYEVTYAHLVLQLYHYQFCVDFE